MITRALAVAVLAALVVPVAHGAADPVRVKGIEQIGALRILPSAPADARRVFGKPLSTAKSEQGCSLRWTGLSIGYYTLLDKNPCVDGSFESAAVSRDWVTDRGLRRGDTLARAKALYPRWRSGGKTSIWLIARNSPAIGVYGLSARIREGRLVTLDLYNPQGGE